MRIGYRTPGLKEFSFAEKLKLAQDLGLEAVEFSRGEFEGAGAIDEVRERAEEMGITLSAMGGGFNLCNPELLKESYAACERALKFCEKLGIDILFSRTLSPDSGIPQKETWKTCAEATRTVAEMAADRGIKFALEADPPCFVQNLERVERLLEMVNHPNLYVNFDPTNYYIVGSDPLKVIERLGHLMINGHIKDGIYRQEKKGEVAIGAGEVEYAEIFRALMEKKIDIVMSIEHCRTAEQVTSASQYIKKVLAEIESG